MTDRDMNMVHYPVFAEPFVLVVIRGALDMLQLIQPQVADIFGLWRIRFPPVLVRTGRRLPVQSLGDIPLFGST